MSNEPMPPRKEAGSSKDLDRREFVVFSVAAGLAATSGCASTPPPGLAETDVSISTPDGTCDAAFIRPEANSHPGVLLWSDAFGLRPSIRGLARRLAGSGYAVLAPNPFYRMGKGPFMDASTFDFKNEAQMTKLKALIASVSAPGNAEKDAKAYIEFLDSQKEVSTVHKIGTQGYCMGGPLVLRTAAAVPGRVGAGASFHGGGLVTDKPDSPHLLAPRIKAQLYIAIAANDDAKQPEAKNTLREAFARAKVPAEIEVYPNAQHGWCIPDMPTRAGVPIYNPTDADRAWEKLLALYHSALS